ncbi:MAG TPA: ATP-binding cassette domain-containing protein, partial [Pirellulaceae bacterium]|nr:ATP-binding cassette domain-containing protein [Pirellulaceae bacterium]
RHARLRRVDGQVLLTDLGSMNGTFVNGRRVTSETTLSIGDRIGIGPFLLTFTGAALVADNRSDNVRLCARGLSRSYSPGGGAPARTLLDDVSIVIPPRSFVCLLGPSGCGKTTLLAALSARSPADHGRVTVNGQDLYDDFDALKRDIVVVPQRDILHEQLPLAEALRYTARLRLPSDTTEAEHGARVAEVLDKVGLAKKAQTLIEKLSGGQRRRASLANELISNPNLLFLDEVTSGLDEQIDGEVMRFCRDLTDGGKTVVCVTHTLANVAQYCHLVVFLGCGGRLAFMGTPAEALEYFEVSRLGDIYSLLENEDDARRWQEKFRASTQYSTYVTEPLNSDGGVRAEPRRSERGRQVRRELREALRQTPILLSRYARVFAADRKALGGLILQCAVIAFVMYLVFGPALRESASTFRRSALAANAVFVLGISCFWFGCNNAAKEIVKERVIFSKELQVNLAVLAYYASKFLLQCGVAAVQALCLLLLVQWCCELPGDFGWQLAVLVAGAISGVAVGLFLSAAASSEEMALTLVPLALVPQIVLSDVFIELTGLSQRLGQMFATNYWIFGALRGTLPDELQEQLNPPLAGPIAIGWSMTATGLHVALLVIASIGVLYVRDDLLATASRPSVEALRNAAKRWRW